MFVKTKPIVCPSSLYQAMNNCRICRTSTLARLLITSPPDRFSKVFPNANKTVYSFGHAPIEVDARADQSSEVEQFMIYCPKVKKSWNIGCVVPPADFVAYSVAVTSPWGGPRAVAAGWGWLDPRPDCQGLSPTLSESGERQTSFVHLSC